MCGAWKGLPRRWSTCACNVVVVAVVVVAMKKILMGYGEGGYDVYESAKEDEYGSRTPDALHG